MGFEPPVIEIQFYGPESALDFVMRRIASARRDQGNNVDLETGKSLNIAPPGWQKTFGPLRDAFNHEHGWSRPDDPARARAQQPGHRAYVVAALKRCTSMTSSQSDLAARLRQKWETDRREIEETAADELRRLGESLSSAARSAQRQPPPQMTRKRLRPAAAVDGRLAAVVPPRRQGPMMRPSGWGRSPGRRHARAAGPTRRRSSASPASADAGLSCPISSLLHRVLVTELGGQLVDQARARESRQLKVRNSRL